MSIAHSYSILSVINLFPSCLNNILSDKYTVFYLVLGIWVTYITELLRTLLIWTRVSRCLCGCNFSPLRHRCANGITGSHGNPNLLRTIQTLSQQLQHFVFPSAVHWVPGSPNVPSTIIFDCHPSRIGMVSTCGLYMISPDSWQSWGLFHMDVDQFSILSGTTSIYLISRMKSGCLSFNCCVAICFLKYILVEHSISHILFEYVSPVAFL